MTLDNESTWYMDTGASNHMSGHRHLFQNLKEGVCGSVSFGDASKVQVMGKGRIGFLLKNGRTGAVEDVYYVPEIKVNILSVGQLLQKGYEIHTKGQQMQLRDKTGRVVISSEMESNQMFKVNLEYSQEKCLQIEKSTTSLWHKRFGHLNYRALKLMAKNKMIHGLPDIVFDGEFCESCTFGKQGRNSFPKGTTYKTRERLNLVHSDICKPITPGSFGGKRYFITFIDDFTRRTWVYFLK